MKKWNVTHSNLGLETGYCEGSWFFSAASRRHWGSASNLAMIISSHTLSCSLFSNHPITKSYRVNNRHHHQTNHKHRQQNSFNLEADTLEIMIFQWLKNTVPKWRSPPIRSPIVSVQQLSWHLLTLCLLLHHLLQPWKLQKTQKRNLITLNQQMKETFKWNAPLISCEAQI